MVAWYLVASEVLKNWTLPFLTIMRFPLNWRLFGSIGILKWAMRLIVQGK
jgi:hypothetical protein